MANSGHLLFTTSYVLHKIATMKKFKHKEIMKMVWRFMRYM